MVSTILFPATYAAFYKRVDQDITAFVRDDQRAQCPAMEWMVRCYVTWYIAKRNNDNERLDQSRYIYGVLLRYLRGILDHPRQRQSDVAVVIAVLLVLYELFDESSPEAWLVHLKGVKELLRQRGANVHLKGFSRTLLLTCRGFFIAEAFAMQEDCFLAESAWMAVSKKAFEREERAGRGCRLVSLIDKAYREIVRVPGLVVQVRSVMGSGCELRNDDGVGGWSSREEIRAKIQRSLAVLRRLRRSFTCAAELDVTPGRVADLDSNSEPLIDVRYLPEIARYNLHGVCAVEGLLDRLIETLGDENNGTSVQRGSGGRVAISERIRRDTTAIVKSGRTLGSSLLAGGSMDDMFLTMGAMAIGTAT
ncbi:hypothetical protein BDW59DRAFT_150065 [Aspergillus cavernicola]|uniref:Uncharacterized protein n=1 Tax=Aspergillus cavernicola TaxID=176166 RepID=A0ABR4I0Y7_9EURO